MNVAQWVQENKRPILIIGAIGLGILLISKSKKAIEVLHDRITEIRIKKLHPEIQEKARNFINKAYENGINLRITSGLRTWAEQDKLYAKGRTEAGNVVTNAKGGQSYHNFGLAFDVVPIVNSKADWNSARWNEIGSLGKSFGFEWGGDWKNLVDKPHFQMRFGKNLTELRSLYTSGKKDGNYVYLT